MDEPTPATDWPDRPLTEAEAVELLEDVEGAVAVHVMDHDDAVRRGVDADPDDVIEVVVETDTGYRMYSYTADPDAPGAVWTDYGVQSKTGEGAASMRETLAPYRVVAGKPEES